MIYTRSYFDITIQFINFLYLYFRVYITIQLLTQHKVGPLRQTTRSQLFKPPPHLFLAILLAEIQQIKNQRFFYHVLLLSPLNELYQKELSFLKLESYSYVLDWFLQIIEHYLPLAMQVLSSYISSIHSSLIVILTITLIYTPI